MRRAYPRIDMRVTIKLNVLAAPLNNVLVEQGRATDPSQLTRAESKGPQHTPHRKWKRQGGLSVVPRPTRASHHR